MKPLFKYGRAVLSEERGVALVLAIASIVLFCIFFLVVIDIAYLYFVRGQLHNAADASALAGAQFIDKDRGADDQPLADAEAVKYANENFVAGERVGVTPGSDIIYGTWDWQSRTWTANATPVNAIKVVAHRSENMAEEGEFGLVFGGLLANEERPEGIASMAVSSYAIVALPEKVEAPIALCTDSTAMSSDKLPHDFYWSPYPAEANPGTYGIAWTLFDTESQATPTMELIDFFCKQPLGKCPEDPVYLNNGGVNSAARQFRCAFSNPDHDRHRKTFDTTDPTKVLTWKVLTPILETCPPGVQPAPQNILGYAWVTLSDVYADGMSPSHCACNTLFTDHPSIYSTIKLTGKSPNGVRIDSVEYPANVEVNACPNPRHLGITALVE